MKHRLFSTLFCIWYALALFFTGAIGGFLPATPARADALAGEYACILQTDTFFYATPDESRGLFLLPQSYYVKLVERGEEYCRAEYLTDENGAKKVTGYVKTNQLTFVDYLPKRPYAFHQFTLRYRIDEGSLDDSAFLNEITVQCTYYGDYKIGSKTYCYVLREEDFGYVPKPTSLTLPENTEYAEYVAQLEASAPVEPPQKEEPTSSPAQVAILIALCLLVPVLAALILKPPRRPPYDVE